METTAADGHMQLNDAGKRIELPRICRGAPCGYPENKGPTTNHGQPQGIAFTQNIVFMSFISHKSKKNISIQDNIWYKVGVAIAIYQILWSD